MRKIKEKRMQSYVLRARKMVQEGKNKEGAEMLSEGLNYYSKNIIKALTPSCAALEGTKIGMDDEFKTVSGRREITTSIPPLHPRCKCAVKYVRVKNENIQ